MVIARTARARVLLVCQCRSVSATCGTLLCSLRLDVRNNHISHYHIHPLLDHYKKTPNLSDRITLELGGNQVCCITTLWREDAHQTRQVHRRSLSLSLTHSLTYSLTQNDAIHSLTHPW